MVHKQDDKFQVLMIPIVVVNGVVSGIVSVITAYLFKPLWNKLMGYFHK